MPARYVTGYVSGDEEGGRLSLVGRGLGRRARLDRVRSTAQSLPGRWACPPRLGARCDRRGADTDGSRLAGNAKQAVSVEAA